MFKFLFKLVEPRSTNEDLKRREFILNVLLLGLFILSVVAFSVVRVNLTELGAAYNGIPPEILLIISLNFLALYFFSRAGFYIPVAYILIGICFGSATYTVYTWGVDIPEGLLVYALIIVMSGVLINTKFAFAVTLITTVTLFLFAYFQINMIISPHLYWRKELTKMNDIVTIGFTLGLIAVVSWLSNREIEKALHRARKSEKVLKKEKDLLELRVEERTRELKKIQLEKMAQLYRFADFGRLSAGLFHDFVNPLTAVSLNLEQLGTKGKSLFVKRALEGVRRMESFVGVARKQIQNQETKGIFVLDQEIIGVVNVLASRAEEAGVDVSFLQEKGYEEIRTFGNPIRFHQLVCNLVLNAIDAYEEVNRPENRRVVISLSAKSKEVELIVQDFGVGISKKNLGKIFEPFFTTKAIDKGMGIGLSLSKDIVEKNFGGKIKVKSIAGEGTIFTVDFPIREAID